MHNNKFCKIEMRAFFMYGIGSRLLDSSLLRQGKIERFIETWKNRRTEGTSEVVVVYLSPPR